MVPIRGKSENPPPARYGTEPVPKKSVMIAYKGRSNDVSVAPSINREQINSPCTDHAKSTVRAHENRSMSIFAIIQQNPAGPSGRLADAIERDGNPSYALSEEVWLYSLPGTAREVSELLGIADGSNGSAVVVEVGSYFGRANPAIWSWIKQNWEGTPIG